MLCSASMSWLGKVTVCKCHNSKPMHGAMFCTCISVVVRATSKSSEPPAQRVSLVKWDTTAFSGLEVPYAFCYSMSSPLSSGAKSLANVN